MKLTTPPRTSLLSSASIAAGCFIFCLVVQYLSAAWQADFTAYPDEASHFVGAVMMRDWLASGRWLAPVDFARNFYSHYPYFAIGYWPPLFSGVTGCWLLIAGVGRLQALLIPAACAAATAFLIVQFVRRRAGLVLGCCAGAVYLSVPAVRFWMGAVMADHMTTFLCLASAACVLRYLERPVLWNGILCAACCACAILSKYSAAYTIALPFAAIFCLRRFDLLKNPSLWAQPVIIALIVGPWAFWTRHLALYGLPAEQTEPVARRAAAFLLGSFEIFLPALMGIVILGLAALLFFRRAWGADLTVLSLLALGHLSLLLLSPVDIEDRYLLVPAAVLLVLSFAGWSELIASAPLQRWAGAVPALAVLLTIVFSATQFASIVRRPTNPIKPVVDFLAKDTSGIGRRIVVPPDFEGPFIAEFLANRRHQPDVYLLRPGKMLARSDWFGGNYSSTFENDEQMMDYFRQNPVNLILWSERTNLAPKPHAVVMKEMLKRYPFVWRPVLLEGSWTIYAFQPEFGAP